MVFTKFSLPYIKTPGSPSNAKAAPVSCAQNESLGLFIGRQCRSQAKGMSLRHRLGGI